MGRGGVFRNIISLAAAGVVAKFTDTHLLGLGWSVWVASPLIFLAAYLSGRVFQPAAREPGQPFFLEDFVRDVFFYLALGLLAAAAVWGARQVIGGQARPWVAALGVYAFFTFHRNAN